MTPDRTCICCRNVSNETKQPSINITRQYRPRQPPLAYRTRRRGGGGYPDQVTHPFLSPSARSSPIGGGVGGYPGQVTCRLPPNRTWTGCAPPPSPHFPDRTCLDRMYPTLPSSPPLQFSDTSENWKHYLPSYLRTWSVKKSRKRVFALFTYFGIWINYLQHDSVAIVMWVKCAQIVHQVEDEARISVGRKGNSIT